MLFASAHRSLVPALLLGIFVFGAALGCGSGAPLKQDGGTAGAAAGHGGTAGAGGGAAGTGGQAGQGVAGAGGTTPLGQCDTSDDCEPRTGCCGGSCNAKTDPTPAQPMVCNHLCPVGGASAGPLVCGCVNHQCAYFDSGLLPACTWPASLDAPDAGGTGACHPARLFLSCDGSNGVSEGCLSDDPSHCPGDDATPGVTYSCHDTCAPNEYAVSCGSIGGGSSVDPPAGCHSALATPAGIVFFCCPCL
jgi:hypothetical protein